jgi:hypothetical protein
LKSWITPLILSLFMCFPVLSQYTRALPVLESTDTPTAEDWHYAMTSPIGDKFYYDRHSAIRKGDMVTYTERMVYGRTLQEEMSLITGRPVFMDHGPAYLDCAARTVQRLQLKAVPIEPGSDMDKVRQDLCDTK